MNAKRLIDLWSRIDDYMQDNEYYDDQEECTVCEATEASTYFAVVQEKDIKFLGAKTIREEIHKFFTNYSYRHEKLLENCIY